MQGLAGLTWQSLAVIFDIRVKADDNLGFCNHNHKLMDICVTWGEYIYIHVAAVTPINIHQEDVSLLARVNKSFWSNITL